MIILWFFCLFEGFEDFEIIILLKVITFPTPILFQANKTKTIF